MSVCVSAQSWLVSRSEESALSSRGLICLRATRWFSGAAIKRWWKTLLATRPPASFTQWHGILTSSIIVNSRKEFRKIVVIFPYYYKLISIFFLNRITRRVYCNDFDIFGYFHHNFLRASIKHLQITSKEHFMRIVHLKFLIQEDEFSH